MSRWYKLNPDHTYFECDIMESDLGNDTARVARTKVADDVEVSTVFLGLDHSHIYSGLPILFETMVFGGKLDQEQERYSTWDEAVKGHEEMVERVKNEYL